MDEGASSTSTADAAGSTVVLPDLPVRRLGRSRGAADLMIERQGPGFRGSLRPPRGRVRRANPDLGISDVILVLVLFEESGLACGHAR
jgi:hypothetical protein